MSDYKGGFAFPVKGKGNYAFEWKRASDKATWLYSSIVVVK